MKILSIIIVIVIVILMFIFLLCTCILNTWLNESGLRYHLYDDKEGENNGKTDTRKSNRLSKSVSETKRVRKK